MEIPKQSDFARRPDVVAPVRLIFVNRFFFPDESATSLMLTDLVFSLESEAFERHAISSRSQYAGGVAAPPRFEQIDGVLIHRMPALEAAQSSLVMRTVNFAIFFVCSFFTVLRIARRDDVIVCLTDPPLGNLACLVAARIKRARLVNWVQDIYPEVVTRLGYGSETNWAFKLITSMRNKCWRAADANVVLGERMAEHLRSCTAPPARIHVIGNWAEEEALAPLAPEANPLRAQWGYGTGDCVIGYSGNLGRAHDIATVLRAVEMLAERQDKSLRFLFIGGGAKNDELRRRATDLPQVEFRDYQPRAQLRESLGVPDIHWLSLSPTLEGLIVPSKFYGAAAVGRPVIFIGDPSGEIPRLIALGQCGRSFLPGQSAELMHYLLKLSADRALRERLGRNARAFAEDYLARGARLAEWARLLRRFAPPGSYEEDGAREQPHASATQAAIS